MTQTIRNAAMVAALFLLGSCVSVGQIQQTEPVRTTNFKGDHKAMAQCIQQRVGGKVQGEAFGDRYVVYDSVKGQEGLGLTHYAFTIARTGPDEGIVQWRIKSPVSSGPEGTAERAINPGGLAPARGTLTDSAVRRYWGPVEECAAIAKRN